MDPNAGHLSTWNPTTEKKAAQLQNLAKDLAKRNQAVIEMEEVLPWSFERAELMIYSTVDSPWGVESSS